jgi:two-component system CheB/CheR fusion protein
MEMSDKAVLDVTERLFQERAIDFRDYKPSTLRRRIKRRMDATHREHVSDYLELLDTQPEECNELIDSILINVTQFFRDPEAWDLIREQVIPRILADKRKGDQIKVWSAGCATGEEAYTLAMLFNQALKDRKHDHELRVYATDVDENALAVARRGAYVDKSMECVPEELREEYFKKNGVWTVSRELRKTVIFGRHNLVNDAPISHCDLIVCRNVLIYMGINLQNQLLSKFHYALDTPGFMFLGKAEAMLTLSRLFSSVSDKARIFTKEAPGGAVCPAADQRALGAAVDAGATEYQLISLFNEAVLRHAPVGVIGINGNNVVRLVNPAAERLWGFNSRDLLGKSLVEVPLPPALQGLVQKTVQVRHDKREFTIDEMVVTTDRGKETYLSVRITPMFDVRGNPGGVIVLAEDLTIAVKLRRDVESANDELNSTNEELETTNEELQSTNEELTTTNEELQSTNEELETTNEELQSTNEELETTNDELEARTQELNRTKDELEERNKDLESLNEALSEEVARRTAAELFLQKYRMLSGNLRDIILFNRQDGRIVEANDAAVAQYGYTRDELLSMAAYDLRAPEERDVVTAQMATAGDIGILFETMHYRKDGSSFPVEVSSRGADIGGERLLLSVIRDITERRAAEDKISSLALFPYEDPNPILRVDRDGVLLYANPAAAVLARALAGSVGSEAPPLWRDLAARAMTDGSIQSSEHEHEDRVYSYGIAPVAESGYVNLYIHDITDRKLAEAGLARAFEREHRIAAILQDALIPQSHGNFGDVAYEVRYRPAWDEAEVGGDFCEAAMLSGDLAVVAIGDVSGKGLEAAVQGSMAKNMLLALRPEPEGPLHHPGLRIDRPERAHYALRKRRARACVPHVGHNRRDKGTRVNRTCSGDRSRRQIRHHRSHACPQRHRFHLHRRALRGRRSQRDAGDRGPRESPSRTPPQEPAQDS